MARAFRPPGRRLRALDRGRAAVLRPDGAGAGRTQAETAAVCGFYDQAYPSGEFRAMTGRTPREFTAVRRTLLTPSGGPPSADRLADEPTSLVLA